MTVPKTSRYIPSTTSLLTWSIVCNNIKS